ncbi:MAG: hypothetical protein IJ629_04560 [Clostridia bacterium]|nr:hypothetical protein [Clostridia bacterium]
MKRTGKIFVSMSSLGVLLNNVAYAATEVAEESREGLPTKYIFMGVAALVIVLLLFLGYKMDTKESGSTTKVSHKAKKTRQKLSAKAEAIQQNFGEYEADEDAYEADEEEFDNDDLNDSIEYNDDEEDSLYSVASEDEDEDEDEDEGAYEENEGGFTTGTVNPVVVDSYEPETEMEPELEEIEEDSGEEFDTSIIDGLDDDIDPKKSFDETMLFNNSDFSATGSSLEDEIDNLENIKDIEIESADEEEESSFIDELKSFEQPESDFEGFSVASKKEEKMEEFKEMEEKSGAEELDLSNEEIADIPVDNEFLSQMEANLQKNQEERKRKTEPKTYTKARTKKTTKKKEDK